MELEITTLIENEPGEIPGLVNEHGLSLYIVFDGKRILFDTGQTGRFVSNAGELGISLDETDAVILSHGHYDHSGGMMTLLDQVRLGPTRNEEGNKQVPIYVGKGFFDRKYKRLPDDGTMHYNGNPFTEEELREKIKQLGNLTLTEVDENVTYLTERICLVRGFERVTSYEQLNPKFFVERKCKKTCKTETELQAQQDDFAEEVALVLRTTKGLVVIAGCSHVGIVNILTGIQKRFTEPVYAVLGGTHLVEADDDRILATIEALKPVQQIAVSHCTGAQGEQKMQKAFGDRFIRNNTGNRYLL